MRVPSAPSSGIEVPNDPDGGPWRTDPAGAARVTPAIMPRPGPVPRDRVTPPCCGTRRLLSRGFWFWRGRVWYVTVREDAEAVLAAKFAVMRSLLSERQWRVYLGA